MRRPDVTRSARTEAGKVKPHCRECDRPIDIGAGTGWNDMLCEYCLTVAEFVPR